MSTMYQMSEKDQATVKALNGNDKCADCDTPNPTWASVSFGTLLCIQHSGVHRGLGTHISFVRSLEMDSWSDVQLDKMKHGGNDECNEFLKKHGVDVTKDVRAKYSSRAAQLYKEVLKARVDGKPPPTELPPETKQEAPRKKVKMEGISSSTPPPQKKSHLPTKVVVGVCSAAVAVVGFALLKRYSG